MSETENRILTVLEELRDILRQQAERVSTTLQAFVDVNRESNQKYRDTLNASHKAYQEAQVSYKKMLENQVSSFLATKPWRATVFVISLAVIAVCLVVNLVLRIVRY